jgi:hypothetical protein
MHVSAGDGLPDLSPLLLVAVVNCTHQRTVP